VAPAPPRGAGNDYFERWQFHPKQIRIVLEGLRGEVPIAELC